MSLTKVVTTTGQCGLIHQPFVCCNYLLIANILQNMIIIIIIIPKLAKPIQTNISNQPTTNLLKTLWVWFIARCNISFITNIQCQKKIANCI